MAKTSSAAVDLSAPDDLISFLKAIPDSRYRRGVRYPQWFLLLVAVLGILSDCRSSRDLEAFAKRHREALNQALGLNFKRWPSDATFLYLFNKAHLQEFGDVLQAWMISLIPGGAEGLDQLVCDGKTLRGSAIETEDGHHRFVAQVTVYARALGVALAQKTYDTHESSEKAALKELLSGLDLDGVLIQADAMHTTQAFFVGAWSRGRPPADRQIEPEDPLPPDLPAVREQAQDPFHFNGFREAARASHPLGTQGQGGTRAHQSQLAGHRLDRGAHHNHQNQEGNTRRGLPPDHHQPAHQPRRIAATDPAALEH